MHVALMRFNFAAISSLWSSLLEDFCSIRRTLKHEDCMCEAFEKTVKLIAWRCYFFQHLIKFETWRLHRWSLNRNVLFTNFAEVFQWSLSRMVCFHFCRSTSLKPQQKVFFFYYFCRCIRNSNKIHEKVFCATFDEIWFKKNNAFKIKLNWL